MLNDGQIVESGSYEELTNKNSLFVDFIRNYLESKEANKQMISNNY
jgi:hypothetical protein